MCKVGDIIVVKNYKHNKRQIGMHSFVVLNTDKGQIAGLDYNMICNVMSSFNDEEQRRKKLSLPCNKEITPADKEVVRGNGKDGYIKADKLFYFDKSKIDFFVIGNLTTEFFNELITLINSLTNIEYVIDNL